MISNDFNVWFTIIKIKDLRFAEIVKSYNLTRYFEECWNNSQQALIESDIENKNGVIEELQLDNEELEWENTTIDLEKAELEAEIQTLLSRIVFLEEQLKGK